MYVLDNSIIYVTVIHVPIRPGRRNAEIDGIE